MRSKLRVHPSTTLKATNTFASAPDSPYPVQELAQMVDWSESPCQCDTATVWSFADCGNSCCPGSVRDTTNKKEHVNTPAPVELQPDPNSCVCGDRCCCLPDSKSCECGQNCGCGGMCGCNNTELNDYVIVVNRTCLREKFMADRAEVGDFM
jgi:hypothetical protein